MFWTKNIIKDVIANEISLEYILGEIQELKEEIASFNLSGIRSEWDDVTALVLIKLTQKTSVNLPIISGFGTGAVLRWYDRNIVWKKIFEHHGIPWEQRVLEGGSNYNKIAKIKKAVGASKAPDTALDWKWIKEVVGHFEDEH